MEMSLGHASNFVEALEADVSRRTDDEGCTRERAFGQVVLDYLGYPDEEDYRKDHIADGPGDHGVDFWDVQESISQYFSVQDHRHGARSKLGRNLFDSRARERPPQDPRIAQKPRQHPPNRQCEYDKVSSIAQV